MNMVADNKKLLFCGVDTVNVYATYIVLNCCGPYELYGEIVVKACVAAGTHHVDVSGEPQYISQMQLNYNELAQTNGSYVISNCAFESIPAELAVLYAEKNFNGIINSAELYWITEPNYQDTSSKAIFNSGTWDSVICSMQYSFKLLRLERKLNREQMPSLRPKLWMKPFTHKIDGRREYFAPFPITDRPVVQRSQRLFYIHENKRPIQFEMYIGFKSLFWAIVFPLFLLFGTIFSQFGCTRKLLLKYPHIFSRGIMTHEGPTEANRKAVEFTYILKAKGWSANTSVNGAPNKEMVFKISGKNPCYGVTSNCLLTCAKVILREHQKMPGNGGAIPPGFAFAKTQLLEEIGRCKYGLKFEVLSQ